MKVIGIGCLIIILAQFILLVIVPWAGASICEFEQARQERIAKRNAEKAEKAEAARRAEESARREAEVAARSERERKEREAHAAAEKSAARERESKLRTFALKEAPILWKTYQTLADEIEAQNRRIANLATALKDFDRDPDEDADYIAVSRMRDDMIETRKSMRRKIEDAYLAYRKFQATPGRKEYDELRRKLLEDGIREAEAATRRYWNMAEEK